MALSKQDAQDYIKKYIDSDFDHVFTCSTNIQAIIDVALNLGPIGNAVDAADRAEAAADGAEGAVAGVLEDVIAGTGITIDKNDTRNPILNVTEVTPSTIGLNNVDNTSDLDKQVATLAAADANDVGLGNVDNTADSAKPVSTAQQNALDLKEPIISKDTAFNKAFGTNAGQVAEGNHTHSGGVGDLDQVDNTSDMDKPLSNESIAALALKADATQVLTDVPAGALFTDTNTIYVHPTDDGNKHIPADLGAEAGKVLTATSTAGLYSWEALIPPTGVVNINLGTFLQGVLSDSEKLFTFVATEEFTLPEDLTGSLAYAEVAPTGAATITILVNAVSKGSVNIALGANAATFTFASPVVVAVGDRLQLVAQATADATLADIAITLRGNL
jgi:hypothetical protein